MEFKLKDVLQEKGYIRGPFGSSLKRSELKSSGIPVYEQQHAIYANREFRYYIDEEKYKKMKRFAVKPNDLIISCSGTIGKVDLISEKDKMGIISQALLILRANTDIVLPEYLFYFFKSDYGYNSIISRSMGSVQVNIAKREVIENIKINIPSIKEQEKIVNILSNIDKKIELNNKINNNLHKTVEEIFLQIYECGRKSKLQELLFEIETGSRPKGGAVDKGIPSVGAEKIEKLGVYDFSSEKYINEDYYTKMKNGIIKSGDVLLYKDGAYTGKVTMALNDFPHKKCAVNEHVFILRTKKNWANAFLYFLLYYSKVKEQIISRASSKAAQPGLNQGELKSVIINLPEKEIIKEFEYQVKPIVEMIIQNGMENKRLTQLRQNLLPKLINGEIKLDKIEI